MALFKIGAVEGRMLSLNGGKTFWLGSETKQNCTKKECLSYTALYMKRKKTILSRFINRKITAPLHFENG